MKRVYKIGETVISPNGTWVTVKAFEKTTKGVRFTGSYELIQEVNGNRQSCTRFVRFIKEGAVLRSNGTVLAD